MIRQVPELADGGYWFAVSVTTNGGTQPDLGGEHCAQYGTVGGVLFAVVRTTLPRVVSPAVEVSDVLVAAAGAGAIPASGKFRARIRGH